MLAWCIVLGLWRAPERIRQRPQRPPHARGRHAITQGLLAIGHGEAATARVHANAARRHAAHDPLALLLHAQSAQLDGDRDGAQPRLPRHGRARGHQAARPARAVSSKPSAPTIRLPRVTIAEEALKLAPACDLGLASRAGLSVRQQPTGAGRWPFSKAISIRGPDRQGDLSPAARACC